MKIKVVFSLGSHIFSGVVSIIIWPDRECRMALEELIYILSEINTPRKMHFRSWLTRWVSNRAGRVGLPGTSLNRPLCLHKILCKPSKTTWNLPFERDLISLISKFLPKPCTLKFLKSALMKRIEIPLPNWNGKTWSMGVLKYMCHFWPKWSPDCVEGTHFSLCFSQSILKVPKNQLSCRILEFFLFILHFWEYFLFQIQSLNLSNI